MQWKSAILSSSRSCVLVLLPWVSVLQTGSLHCGCAVCWEKIDQARLDSSWVMAQRVRSSLRLSQSWCSQCILHEVLNEYKNTQIRKAENECDLNAMPLRCGRLDVCSAPASLNPAAQYLLVAYKVEKQLQKVRRWDKIKLERGKL